MDERKVESILFLIAGCLFFISAIFGKNSMNFVLGLLFLALSISKMRNKRDK